MPSKSQCPAELLKGIDEFNGQQFFECHETLEALWQKQPEPERQFTQGIIQIAVGYYHLLRGNREGAIKLFARGLARIRNYEPQHRGINVTALAGAVARNLEFARSAPADASAGLDIPKIQFESQEAP